MDQPRPREPLLTLPDFLINANTIPSASTFPLARHLPGQFTQRLAGTARPRSQQPLPTLLAPKRRGQPI